MTVKQYKN